MYQFLGQICLFAYLCRRRIKEIRLSSDKTNDVKQTVGTALYGQQN